MKRYEKKYSIEKANLMVEQIYLQKKGLITESVFDNIDYNSQINWSPLQTKLYDAWATAKNNMLDYTEQMQKAKDMRDSDTIKALQNKLLQNKHTIKYTEEEFIKTLSGEGIDKITLADKSAKMQDPDSLDEGNSADFHEADGKVQQAMKNLYSVCSNMGWGFEAFENTIKQTLHSMKQDMWS